MPVLVNAKLRTAAATECSKIDALRSDRKPLCDRLSYLGDEGNEEAKDLKNRKRILGVGHSTISLCARERESL